MTRKHKRYNDDNPRLSIAPNTCSKKKNIVSCVTNDILLLEKKSILSSDDNMEFLVRGPVNSCRHRLECKVTNQGLQCYHNTCHK
jgi:hypothetical protein